MFTCSCDAVQLSQITNARFRQRLGKVYLIRTFHVACQPCRWVQAMLVWLNRVSNPCLSRSRGHAVHATLMRPRVFMISVIQAPGHAVSLSMLLAWSECAVLSYRDLCLYMFSVDVIDKVNDAKYYSMFWHVRPRTQVTGT